MKHRWLLLFNTPRKLPLPTIFSTTKIIMKNIGATQKFTDKLVPPLVSPARLFEAGLKRYTPQELAS